jgi:hypothetical protein
LVVAVVSVVPLTTPGPGDPTTQKYIGMAQQELADVNSHITNLQSEIAGLQSSLSAYQETAAELNRMITDLQTGP